MMTYTKKLKDLKIGDSMWLHDFTDTTEIKVVRKKREGDLIRIMLKWDDSEFECFGPALGWSCINYNRRYKIERIFTCDFDKAYEAMMKRRRIMDFAEYLNKLKKRIEEM